MSTGYWLLDSVVNTVIALVVIGLLLFIADLAEEDVDEWRARRAMRRRRPAFKYRPQHRPGEPTIRLQLPAGGIK